MFKLAKFIYNAGRRQAYAEMLTHLEALVVNLPRTRDGQVLRQPINDTITKLKTDLREGDDVK